LIGILYEQYEDIWEQEPAMTAIRTARRFLAAAPREAAIDALGLVAVAAIAAAGFVLPGLL